MIKSDKNIEKIIELMQTDDSVDAPTDTISRSKNIFRSKVPVPKQSVLQRVIGILIQELTPETPALGERSAAIGKVRQMLFEADENRVDLRVSAHDDSFDVRGQILGRGWEGAVVEFAGHTGYVDKFGAFAVKGVGAGIYDLLIKGLSIEIVLRGIELD